VRTSYSQEAVSSSESARKWGRSPGKDKKMPTMAPGFVHRQLFWDSYQSWEDKLPEKYSAVHLFNGHPRGVPKSVCNFQGAGCFPSDQSAVILGMGFQLRCSESHIEDILKNGVVAELDIGDRIVFEMPLSMARDLVLEDERENEREDLVIDIEGGLIKLYDRGIPVPPRQPMRVRLSFHAAAESLIRRIEKRIGPGAGWAEIVVFLLCDVKRPSY
jgi:hypothetical protein